MIRCVCYVSVLLLWCTVPAVSWGQYDVEEKWPVWVRGLVDVRIARGGRASSWTDQGMGIGKSRYGGTGSLLGRGTVNSSRSLSAFGRTRRNTPLGYQRPCTTQC